MPHVSVRIYEIPPENIIEAHLKNPLSILILGVPTPELTRMIKDKPTSLDFFELYRCPILCAASTVSAFCERKVISFEEFSRHPLIIYHNEERLLDHLTLPYDPQGILMRSCSLPLYRTMLAQTPNAVGFSNQLMEHYFKNPSIFTIPLEPIYDLIYGYFLTPCCAENAAYQELIRLMEAETQKI